MVSRVALPDLKTASSLPNVSLPSGMKRLGAARSCRGVAASSGIAIRAAGKAAAGERS